MQDAQKAVFKMWPEVNIKVFVNENNTCASTKGERSNRHSKESVSSTDEANAHWKTKVVVGRGEMTR